MNRFPRDVLLEYKWTEGKCLDKLIIQYKHVGAPDDTKTLPATAIVEMDKSFFYTMDGGAIPFHRILKITRKGNGKVIYDREVESTKTRKR